MPKSPLLKRKASIADLEDITKIQCSNGNWNYDPYMQGLANGMILSLNVATDDPREPLFKEAPEVWLADIHIDPNDPAHQPIPMTAATPKILYWGGRPGAKELIPQNSNYRAGIWLTDSIKVAASFGREIYRVEVTGLNNPFIVDAQGEFYAEIPTPPEMVSEGFTFLDTCDSDLIVQFALQRGHDSVVIKNVVEGFSGGGVGLSHQSGTDYVLLKEGQGKIVSSFDYKSTLDVWGMPKDPKFSAASKKAETAYTDEDLEEWLADLHVDPVEGGTVPMTAADKVARPDQWDTPEFKAWFAGSKVVDAGGNPQTFYHGTPHDIQGGAFDISKQDGTSGGAEGAFWFTSAPEVTTQFAGQAGSVIPAYLKVRNPLRIQPGEIMEFFQDHPWGRETPASVVDPTTHRAKTPGRDGTVILKDHGRVNVFEALKAGWATPVMDGTLRRAVIAKAKAGGYDGVVFHNFHDASDTPSDIVAVFSPTQIKSAIGNSGKFTPDDPRLTAGTHTAAAIDATNWEDYLVPTEEGISEEDLKQVVAASGLAYTAFQTNPLVVTLGDQYMLVKDGQEFFVEEDWGQVLEDIEYDIPFMLLNWIHGRFRLDSEFKLDRKILKLEGYYFRLDHTKKEGDLIPDIEQWVRDLDDSDIWDLVGDPDELYNDVIGSSLKDFHEQPSDVYHYTTEENLEEIIASGELETTSGTGLTNRFAAGVFTSVDPEEYADGTYGNVCLEIDLPAFLRDFPGVKLSFEPEIEDCLAKEQVVGSLNLDGSINVEPDHSGGMSYGTIIVGAAIPLKYITVDGHPLEPKKASKKEATPAKTARPDQWDAPGFAAWFQRSAVIDDEGDPLPVVHRTDADFKRFSSKFLGLNTDGNASDEDLAQTAHIGFWFASKDSNLDSMSGDRSVPCYLSIQEPTYYPSLSALAIAIRDAGGARKFRTQCQSAGHDGVIVEDEEFEGTSYVAFRPTQIKSALANKGRFNPNSPDITASAKTARPIPLDPGVVTEMVETVMAKLDWLYTGGKDTAWMPTPTEDFILEKVSPITGPNGKHHDLYLYVTLVDQQGGSMVQGGARGVLPNGASLVALHLGTGTPKGSFHSLRARIKTSIEGVIRHELTHVVDPSVGNDSTYMAPRSLADGPVTGVDISSMPDYVNDPSEVKAHLAEVMHELETFIQKNPAARRSLTPQQLGNLSETWRMVGPHLSPENRKRFLKEFARLKTGSTKKDETYSLPLSEAVEEHERLVEVLKSPSHADDLKEVKEQEDELREMKEKQAHESQWDTPAFKAWFGNSKVVDRNGNPLMVFHGTQADFDTFDPTKGRGDGYWGKGFYFTDDPSLASGHGWDGNVKPVYLRILNPATPEVVNALEPENLEANGYDGIITGDGVYVVFKPNQIKSAIGNSGAFNPEDNRITASVAYKPFAEASVEEKIERLASNPYHPDRYYHVTDPDAIQSILTTGLKGAEIWVSKGQPWKEYIEGACLELNLEGMELHPDTRWVEEAQTLVAIEPIPASRITRVFDWISEWDMREDQAAKFLSRRGKDEVKGQVMSKFAKVEWDLSPVEDHERAIKLSYKGKLGPNFEVFIYPRQDKGFDCDVHVVTGYGKRNPGVGGNKPYAPYVDFNGTELATAQALATEIKKCMDQELNSLADAARSKGDKALAYNLTREAANLYQEVLNDVTKMLVKLPNPRTNWGKPKASSQGAQARYEALVAELQAIEAKTGLYLTDTNVDRENVGAGDEQSDEFWNSMCYAAEQAAGMRAENAGQDINTLLGRTIY